MSPQWLQRVVDAALAIEREGSSHLSLIVADDPTVKELNRRHRGLDENSDVLSFSFSHQGEYYGDGRPPSEWSESVGFIMPPGETAGLGEVIISYPQALRQAEESAHSPDRELAALAAHGVLHLLGYDHQEPDDAVVMAAKENSVLAKVLEDE